MPAEAFFSIKKDRFKLNLVRLIYLVVGCSLMWK